MIGRPLFLTYLSLLLLLDGTAASFKNVWGKVLTKSAQKQHSNPSKRGFEGGEGEERKKEKTKMLKKWEHWKIKAFTPKENYSPTSVNLMSGESTLVDDDKESLHPECHGTEVKNCNGLSSGAITVFKIRIHGECKVSSRGETYTSFCVWQCGG